MRERIRKMGKTIFQFMQIKKDLIFAICDAQIRQGGPILFTRFETLDELNLSDTR